MLIFIFPLNIGMIWGFFVSGKPCGAVFHSYPLHPRLSIPSTSLLSEKSKYQYRDQLLHPRPTVWSERIPSSNWLDSRRQKLNWNVRSTNATICQLKLLDAALDNKQLKNRSVYDNIILVRTGHLNPALKCQVVISIYRSVWGFFFFRNMYVNLETVSDESVCYQVIKRQIQKVRSESEKIDAVVSPSMRASSWNSSPRGREFKRGCLSRNKQTKLHQKHQNIKQNYGYLQLKVPTGKCSVNFFLRPTWDRRVRKSNFLQSSIIISSLSKLFRWLSCSQPKQNIQLNDYFQNIK